MEAVKLSGGMAVATPRKGEFGTGDQVRYHGAGIRACKERWLL